jgi:hypothetical protein
MRKGLVIAATVIVAIVLSASFLIADNYQFFTESSSKTTPALPNAPVYVGVTYCGNNVTEAKLLIDKVKNYTNLFVIQSGSLQKNFSGLNEICNYAVTESLHVIVYFGSVEYNRENITAFLSNEKLGSNLLGIYYDDEPGGKTLDSSNLNLLDSITGYIVSKQSSVTTVFKPDGTRINYEKNGSVSIEESDNTSIYYKPDGTIQLTLSNRSSYLIEANGTAYLLDDNGKVISQVIKTNKLPKIEPYEQIIAQRPFQTYDEVANSLVNTCQNTTGWLRSQTSVKVFTSDYALYWYDYLGGYDVVLAQLGWNHTETQDIALARGAANLQDKDWGTIITWKYNQKPYLETGPEMYYQMHLAYDTGAKYIVIFNYPTYPDNNQYGILQEEHFSALQRFWNDTVQNKTVTNGGVKAEAVLVLPKNYGWGLRSPQDNIWGIWQPDSTSPQVWAALQACLLKYGSKLDIVYDDSAYHLSGRYQQVYYWNQTI